jgi:hypothetical protein
MKPYQNDLEKIQALIAAHPEDSEGFVESLHSHRINHLSFSQIAAVESCEFRYLLQYVHEKELDPVPEYFVKGKIFHQIIADRYHHLKNGREVSTSSFDKFFEKKSCGVNPIHLRNAIQVLEDHAWRDHKVVAVEYPFVTMIDQDLPPFVGVIDLILRQGNHLVIIDHKTGRDFYEPDTLQMAIYSDHLKSLFPSDTIAAFYDHYRWVENLATIRKPAMKRMEVDLTRTDRLGTSIRIRDGFAKIENIRRHSRARREGKCFACPYRGKCFY